MGSVNDHESRWYLDCRKEEAKTSHLRKCTLSTNSYRVSRLKRNGYAIWYELMQKTKGFFCLHRQKGVQWEAGRDSHKEYVGEVRMSWEHNELAHYPPFIQRCLKGITKVSEKRFSNSLMISSKSSHRLRFIIFREYLSTYEDWIGWSTISIQSLKACILFVSMKNLDIYLIQNWKFNTKTNGYQTMS